MVSFIRNLLGNRSEESLTNIAPIVIVSGLPRSGTSMMMKMLEAGGIPVVIDGIRTADDDNPKGYYEFERAKQLDKGDTAWLADADGKVVKIISALLLHLPSDYQYKVVFMRRKYDEILRSQRKMLINRNEDDAAVSDEEMEQLFEQHLRHVFGWLEKQPNIDVLYVDYNQMLSDPGDYVGQVDTFLPQDLDVDAMIAVVDPDLYRNRG